MRSIDLDVDSPEKVSTVLRCAADRYRESAIDLASSWQDEDAGKVWSKIATILDRAAKSVDNCLYR